MMLEFVGPAVQESPLFGPLVPGERYRCEDAAFGEYLVTRHPDYWRRPSVRRTAAPQPQPVKE